MAVNAKTRPSGSAFLKIQSVASPMVFRFILYLFEEAIQEFNPPEYYLPAFPYEQDGQHSTYKKKGKNTILFWRPGLACDNPNPLLED